MKIASQNRTPPIVHLWRYCRTTRWWGSGAMARSGKRLVSPVTPSPSLCFGMPSGKPIAEGTKKVDMLTASAINTLIPCPCWIFKTRIGIFSG